MSENKISWSEGTTIYKCNDESDFAYFLLEGEILIKSSMRKKTEWTVFFEAVTMMADIIAIIEKK